MALVLFVFLNNKELLKKYVGWSVIHIMFRGGGAIDLFGYSSVELRIFQFFVGLATSMTSTEQRALALSPKLQCVHASINPFLSKCIYLM